MGAGWILVLCRALCGRGLNSGVTNCANLDEFGRMMTRIRAHSLEFVQFVTQRAQDSCAFARIRAIRDPARRSGIVTPHTKITRR